MKIVNNMEKIEAEKIDMEELLEDLSANDDGEYEEVYRSRAGNIVTPPSQRSKGPFKDPRQDACWDLYVKSWKAGVPNARQAALQAGYSENTALNIGNLTWFKKKKDTLRRSKMMGNAERNISRILNMGYTRMKLIEAGKDEDGKPIMQQSEEIDKDVLKIVADMSKTIVTTLGKDLGYSTKTEVKVESLPTPIMELDTISVGVENKLIEANDPVIE